MRALLLLLLPALAVYAAPFPPPLAPERAVSEATPHIASGDQHTPGVASNGEISLVAWTDERIRLAPRVYATRVDAAGNVLDPDGILLSTTGLSTERYGWLEGVVWNGTHFAVSLVENGSRTLVFVAPDGTIAGRRTIDVPGEWADSTDGGAGVRILFLRGGEQPLASIVDGDGDVIARGLPLTGAAERGEFSLAGSRGSEFLVVMQLRPIPSPSSHFVSIRIDGAEGRIGSRRDTRADPDLQIYTNPYTAVEGGGSGWLLVTRDRNGRRLLAQRLDEAGVAHGEPAVLFEVSEDTYINTRVRIARESDRFTVIWSSSQNNQMYTHAAFVTDSVVPAPSRRIEEWPGYRGDNIASAGQLRLLVTSGSRTGYDSDLFVQNVTDSLTASAPVAVAQSPLAQSRVSAAAGRNGYLTAWVEAGPDRAVHLLVRRLLPDGVVQGSPLEAGHGVPGEMLEDVTVASSGSRYLVAWRNRTDLFGRRMDAETGLWLDAAPFAIAEGWDIAVASNGSDAVAVWSSDCNHEVCLQSRRIRLAGDPLAEPVVTLLPRNSALEIAIASNGSDYLAAWTDGNECVEWCPEPDRLQVLALRLRADGTKLDTDALVLVGEDATLQPRYPDVAWNGGRYLVAWSSVPLTDVKVEGALVTAEGAILETRVPLVRGSSQYQFAYPRLLAHREQFVLFAFEAESAPPEYRRIANWTAVSFDADMPLESVAALPRTVIARDPVLTLGAASSGSAILVTYDRFTPPADGGVARAFTRLFGGVGGRRRAVR